MAGLAASELVLQVGAVHMLGMQAVVRERSSRLLGGVAVMKPRTAVIAGRRGRCRCDCGLMLSRESSCQEQQVGASARPPGRLSSTNWCIGLGKEAATGRACGGATAGPCACACPAGGLRSVQHLVRNFPGIGRSLCWLPAGPGRQHPGWRGLQQVPSGKLRHAQTCLEPRDHLHAQCW